MGEIYHYSRFPQPFIDNLSEYVEWSDILTLLSCSKIDDTARSYWIDRKSMVNINKLTKEESVIFLQKYKNCEIKHTINNLSEYVNVNDTLTTHLIFGNFFNQPVDGIKFPKSLKYLCFGHSFNKSINEIEFPESLTHLIIGNSFSKKINTSKLPKSLIHVDIGHSYISSEESARWYEILHEFDSQIKYLRIAQFNRIGCFKFIKKDTICKYTKNYITTFVHNAAKIRKITKQLMMELEELKKHYIKNEYMIRVAEGSEF
jgi:hypothetical protein